MSQPTSPRRANLATSRTRFESTPKQASSPRGASGAGGTEAEKRTALDAATRGDLDLVSAYFPGHFREHDEVARQALHKAANYGNLSIVAYLIGDANVDKDAVDKVTRKTALHYACEKGKLDIVDYLVNDAQVDVTLTDREGHSALDTAVLAGQQEAVHIITDRLIQAAAKQAADDCRPALEAVERERDAALAEAARERAVKETALAMAEGEALEKRELLAELGLERGRRQRAEAGVEELREETKVLASIIAAHEEEAQLWRRASAEQTPAPAPPSPAPVAPAPVPPPTPVAPIQVAMDLPLPPPKVEVVKQEVAPPTSAPCSPSGMSEEGQVSRSAPAVELLRGQLDKERKWRAEAEADREAIQRKFREVEGRLTSEAAKWDEHRGRLEQDVARLQAALEGERAELAKARDASQAMVVAQEAQRAAQEAAANEVVTGFVLKQKQHSLGRDTWEPRFLVAQQGKLRYFNSDKEYLATPRSPRSGSSSSPKVIDLPRSTAAVLPSDDLIFIVRPNDAPNEGEGATASPSSPTSGGGQMLWFRCPDRPARDAWLRSLQAQGCSVSGHAVIGTLPTQGSTRSFRHASTSLQGGEG